MNGFDLKEFKNPSAIHRPVPFYSWNEWMEPEEIRRQIDQMAKAGWGGVFVHSRIGLTTPYLGDEWFQAVEATIEHARKRKMKVWLYDEDKWPSGYSGGSVPLADPSYRQQALVARPARAKAPSDCVKIGNPQNGLQHFIWTAPLGQAWFNGTCYAGLMHREAMQTFLQDAYETYYRRFADEYGKTIVGEFTDEPCSLFRKRVPHGAVPFTPELLDRFRETWKYDPIPHFHLLYQDGEDAPRFRLQYFRIVNELFERNFSQQLGEWCEDHGIALTGHYMLEDSLYGQQTWGVKIMPNYRRQTMPGVDHLGRHVHNIITLKQCQSVVNQHEKPRMLSELYGVAGGSLTFLDRAWIGFQQLCFGVNLLNPHLSLYTMAGCRKRDYPQNIFYQQPWWPLNHILDTPLSRVCASLTQGRYLAEALLIHPGESSFVHWETELDKKQFDGLLDWNHEPTTPGAKKKIDRIDRDFRKVMDTLLGDQRSFDLGDETIIAQEGSLEEVGGRPVIRINKVDYPVVILPTMATLGEKTYKLLDDFLDAGGKVILCGKEASLLEGKASRRLQPFYERLKSVSLQNLPAVLRRTARPLVSAPRLSAANKSKLFVHLRDLPDGSRLAFVVNLNRFRSFSTALHFRGEFESVRELNFHNGEASKLQCKSVRDRLEITLPFAPAQAHLLLLTREKIDGKGVSPVPRKDKQRRALSQKEWEVERLDDNAITLDYANWRTATGSFSGKPSPVLGIQEYLNSCRYDGPLTLRYPVQVGSLADNRKVHLVVEYPERYEIRVNGTPLKQETLPFWRDFRWHPIDITGLLKAGCENIIQLDCPEFQHGDLTSVEDMFARYGTEIESIYLVGDFSVFGRLAKPAPLPAHWKEFELPPVSVHGFEYGSFILEDPERLKFGDTTSRGLPFYAGRLSCTTTLPKLSRNGRWFLRLQDLDCPVAEVKVDGTVAGHFMLNPFEVDLTPFLEGKPARLELILYGTLRNLLGPHHNPEGEMARVGPHQFSALPAPGGNGVNEWVLNHQKGKPVKQWTDSYCMVSFGKLGRATLVRR